MTTQDFVQKSQVGRKKRKKKSNIDFSYMDLDGARIYAPADGLLYNGLVEEVQKELKEQYPQMERIYLVEVCGLPRRSVLRVLRTQNLTRKRLRRLSRTTLSRQLYWNPRLEGEAKLLSE